MDNYNYYGPPRSYGRGNQKKNYQSQHGSSSYYPWGTNAPRVRDRKNKKNDTQNNFEQTSSNYSQNYQSSIYWDNSLYESSRVAQHAQSELYNDVNIYNNEDLTYKAIKVAAQMMNTIQFYEDNVTFPPDLGAPDPFGVSNPEMYPECFNTDLVLENCIGTSSTIDKTKSQKRSGKHNDSYDIQKNLLEGFSQPVQSTKAQRMMQKMGWQGGALGLKGEGLTEPIIPNLFQQNRAGLGLTNESETEPTPKPEPGPKRKSQPKPNPSVHNMKPSVLREFKGDVFAQILDFVKDNTKAEMEFDSSLGKRERWIIHQVVEHVRDMNVGTGRLNLSENTEMIHEIWKCNKYLLYSESYGEFPDRKITLYKEAPENVYLITPYDLRQPEEEKKEEVGSSNDDDHENSLKNEDHDNANVNTSSKNEDYEDSLDECEEKKGETPSCEDNSLSDPNPQLDKIAPNVDVKIDNADTDNNDSGCIIVETADSNTASSNMEIAINSPSIEMDSEADMVSESLAVDKTEPDLDGQDKISHGDVKMPIENSEISLIDAETSLVDSEIIAVVEATNVTLCSHVEIKNPDECNFQSPEDNISLVIDEIPKIVETILHIDDNLSVDSTSQLINNETSGLDDKIPNVIPNSEHTDSEIWICLDRQDSDSSHLTKETPIIEVEILHSAAKDLTTENTLVNTVIPETNAEITEDVNINSECPLVEEEKHADAESSQITSVESDNIVKNYVKMSQDDTDSQSIAKNLHLNECTYISETTMIDEGNNQHQIGESSHENIERLHDKENENTTVNNINSNTSTEFLINTRKFKTSFNAQFTENMTDSHYDNAAQELSINKLKILSEWKKWQKSDEILNLKDENTKNLINNNEERIKDDAKKPFTKREIRELLMQYLKEFFEEKKYNEIRFLGEFDELELETVTEFVGDVERCIVDVEYCDYVESVVDFDLRDVFHNDELEFSVERENGEAVIYKKPRGPISNMIEWL